MQRMECLILNRFTSVTPNRGLFSKTTKLSQDKQITYGGMYCGRMLLFFNAPSTRAVTAKKRMKSSFLWLKLLPKVKNLLYDLE